MPQDKKLSYKDYVAGKGNYDDKYAGTIGQYDPDGFYEGKRASRVEAGGRHAQQKTNEDYEMNKFRDLGMLKELSHSLSVAKNAEKAGRAKGMSEIDAMKYGTQTAKNSRGSFDYKTRKAKPVSAAAGAKMVGAMMDRPARKSAPSVADIQKGMAASTRKTQAASAAKKAAPAPSMRKLLKIK